MTVPRRPGAAAPAASGPRADCTADSAGGLSFDLVLPDGGERWDAALLLHRRDAGDTGDAASASGEAVGHGDESTVRLPLFPSGEGRLRAALPSTMTLTEGLWDAYVSLGDRAPRRLRYGSSELSSLVDRVPGTHRTWLGVRVPYATRHGNLTVRAWLRWPHAEVTELRTEDGVLRVSGRLYGAELADGAGLEARPRLPDRPPVFVPAATPAGEGGGTQHGGRFHCALPLARLPEAGEWDLWLRPSGNGGVPDGPVRVARIMDDDPDKRHTVSFPPCPTPAGAATPYYTRDNDVAVRVARAGR